MIFFADRAEAWVKDEEGVRRHMFSGESVPAAEKVLQGREVA